MPLLAVAAAVIAGVQTRAQRSEDVASLLQNRSVKAAREAVRAGEAFTIDEQVRFCQIPAPPFKEAARADALRRAFQDAGLVNVRIDRVGNVLGDRPGKVTRPRLVVAAHLDTVFPEETDVSVVRQGTSLRGPGIGDNCRGLSVLVAVARALRQGGVETPGSITFVANVGEEGLGDLRGVKALFGETLKGQIDRFVSIDGPGLHVTQVAVGSRRYRVTFKGPGGHSFASFGQPNPANALGRAIARIADLDVPSLPVTTFNVGRVGGGTSVNAVPSEAWLEIDLRSESAASLAALDDKVQAALEAAAADENRRASAHAGGRATARVIVTKELVGDRPAGSISPSSPIVRTVQAVSQALFGTGVPLSRGSTDANLPISLNIPAVTIGGGGEGSDAHAVTEIFDSAESWKGTENALLVTIALAQR